MNDMGLQWKHGPVAPGLIRAQQSGPYRQRCGPNLPVGLFLTHTHAWVCPSPPLLAGPPLCVLTCMSLLGRGANSGPAQSFSHPHACSHPPGKPGLFFRSPDNTNRHPQGTPGPGTVSRASGTAIADPGGGPRPGPQSSLIGSPITVHTSPVQKLHLEPSFRW